MADYDFIKMQKKLSKYLDEDRFEHTLGVMFTCASLAMVHGYNLNDAQAAGLLHDSAECMYAILRDTLTYLDKNPDDVDSATKDAFAYYDTLHKERQESR